MQITDGVADPCTLQYWWGPVQGVGSMLHFQCMSKIQGMDLEIATAAALRGHSRGHNSPKKITALPSNRMVNTSIEIINTSIELINTSIETYVALAFSFMHALNIMFTSPQAITQSLAIML